MLRCSLLLHVLLSTVPEILFCCFCCYSSITAVILYYYIGYSFTITAVIPLPLDLLFLYYYSCYSYEHTLASHIKNLLTFVS